VAVPLSVTEAKELERGADPLAGHPFARAFVELRTKTTLGSFLDCRRARPDLGPRLQEQADMALRQFCQNEDEKWVSLMMWVGADPRSRGPAVDDIDHADDPDYHTTAFEEAAGAGNARILKLLKPRASDDLAHLLERAAFGARSDVVACLLELGANPNGRPDGGSGALEACIRHQGWEDSSRVLDRRDASYQSPAHKVSNGREAIKLLLRHGAVWKPDPSSLNDTRRILYRIEPEVAVELVGQLLKTPGGEAGVGELLRVPRMRQHLAGCATQLAQLGVRLEGERRPRVQTERPPSASGPARYDRDRLYEEVWSEPIAETCSRYGLSEAALLGLCKTLEIPTPRREGHVMQVGARATTGERPKLLALGFRRRSPQRRR
jgi:hypothetical protein